jgi:hypothetical protein
MRSHLIKFKSAILSVDCDEILEGDFNIAEDYNFMALSKLVKECPILKQYVPIKTIFAYNDYATPIKEINDRRFSAVLMLKDIFKEGFISNG